MNIWIICKTNGKLNWVLVY